jgi:hypothetical protein
VDDFESFSVSPRPDGKLSVAAAMAVRYSTVTLYKISYKHNLSFVIQYLFAHQLWFVILGLRMASKGITDSY